MGILSIGSKLRRFLMRRVMAPHWLQVALVGVLFLASTRLAMDNPNHLVLIILGGAIIVVLYAMLTLAPQRQTEDKDTSLDTNVTPWDRFRTHRVWDLSLGCIVSSLYVLSFVFGILLP